MGRLLTSTSSSSTSSGIKLSLRNTIIDIAVDNKMLTSAKHMAYLFSITTNVKSADLIGHIKFLLWQLLSVKGVACKTSSF